MSIIFWFDITSRHKRHVLHLKHLKQTLQSHNETTDINLCCNVYYRYFKTLQIWQY